VALLAKASFRQRHSVKDLAGYELRHCNSTYDYDELTTSGVRVASFTSPWQFPSTPGME